MKLFIFDIDDTLIIHTNEDTDYYTNKGDKHLRSLIQDSISDRNYVFTNGTYGHAEGVKIHFLTFGKPTKTCKIMNITSFN